MPAFFSVIIPTYNRAELLGRAIQSVLDQTEHDLELVVSNGGSTDNTRAVVETFDDDRIRYVEANGKPDMAGNYSTAVQNATGRFVVFFSDDDALVPRALEKLKTAINKTEADLVVFPFARYYPEGGSEGHRRIPPNAVLIPRHSCELKKIPAELALRQYFYEYGLTATAPSESVPVPYIGNYAIRGEILDDIGRDSESLFAQIPIDNYLIGKILSLIDYYYLLDEPLLVWSRWRKQATALVEGGGTKVREHYQAQLKGRLIEQSPFTFPLPKNLGANALAQARADLTQPLHTLEPNWQHFVPYMEGHLLYLRDNGMDVTDELEEVRRIIASSREKYAAPKTPVQPANLIRSFLRRALPSRVKYVISSFSRRSDKMDVINGGAKFNDFLTCARYLDLEVCSERMGQSTRVIG